MTFVVRSTSAAAAVAQAGKVQKPAQQPAATSRTQTIEPDSAVRPKNNPDVKTGPPQISFRYQTRSAREPGR